MVGGSKSSKPVYEVWVNVYSDYSYSAWYNNKYNARYLADPCKTLIYRLHVRKKGH